MYTIVLASRKGGAGKTTLAVHMAVEAYRRGDGPVGIIDADPMEGMARWFNARAADAPGPVFLQVGKDGLTATLRDAATAGIKIVVIDTPPAASEAIHAIVQACDLVVIPVIPSPNDLRAVGETIDLVEQAAKPFLFVLNKAAASVRLTGQASRQLSQDGPVASVTFGFRQDYMSSMIDGRAAGEIKGGKKAAEEASALWLEISSRLKTGARRRVTKTV